MEGKEEGRGQTREGVGEERRGEGGQTTVDDTG